GEVLLATGRVSDAETVLIASMNRWKRSGAPTWRVMRSASALGEALFREGRTEEAEKYLSESFRVLSGDTAPDVDTQTKARERFVRYVKKPPLPQRATTTKLTVATQ